MHSIKTAFYTGEDVKREAEAYRAWARQKDREQYHAAVFSRILAAYEARGHVMQVQAMHSRSANLFWEVPQ